MPKRRRSSRVLTRLNRYLGDEPEKFVELLAEKMVSGLGRTEPPFQTGAFEYAALAGARVIQTDSRNYSGAMSVFDGDIVIHVRRDDSLERKNFTVCHEIGHIELRKAAGLLKPSRTNDGSFLDLEKSHEGTTTREELLVHEFAANLLMPKKVFSEKAKSLVPGLESVQALSKIFLTSLGATVRRIISLKIWPCIVVWGVPEKMVGEDAWAVKVQEFKSTFRTGLSWAEHKYIWWAGKQFWRASQSEFIVEDTVAIEGKCWRFEGLREWHYVSRYQRENRVMAMFLPPKTA